MRLRGQAPRAQLATIGALALMAAACASGSRPQSPPTAPLIPISLPPPPSPTGPASCPTGSDYILLVHTVGVPDTAQIIASYEWVPAQKKCLDAISYVQAITPTDVPDCNRIARIADNPGYDVHQVPARPLNAVVASFGIAC